MAGPPLSCRTWLNFDLFLEWGLLSSMASFLPSGEGCLCGELQDGDHGIGTMSLLSLSEWDRLCPVAPCVILGVISFDKR